jgi:hypothetical protein
MHPRCYTRVLSLLSATKFRSSTDLPFRATLRLVVSFSAARSVGVDFDCAAPVPLAAKALFWVALQGPLSPRASGECGIVQLHFQPRGSRNVTMVVCAFQKHGGRWYSPCACV